MAWKKVRIKDIFDFEKWHLQSSKNTPWKYDFITASSERKTHDTFSHEWEYLIFAMAASGSLWRTHYVNWKFISSDLCFILTPKNPKQINMKFYHIYFNLIRKDIVSKTATGSAKIAINQNNFWNYEIIVWDIEEQNKIFEKINSLAPNIEKLLNIFDNQDLVKRLRQSILQDAIQGKLVSQDPNDEPASELLKKIKAEKDQLIKEKKIKKGKELEPITDNEKTFNLPKHWEWCRLGEVFSTSSWWTPDRSNAWYYWWNIPRLKSWELNDNMMINKSEEFITEDWLKNSSAKVFKKWTLLLALYWATAWKLWILNIDASTNQAVCNFEDNKFIETRFLFYYLQSIRSKIIDDCFWAAQPNISQDYVKKVLFPLPPLAEQQRIVAKVDELMKFCDNLEKQISEAKENGEKLMESVLGEVFK